MRITELNRASRRPVPPRELPDDVRSGDFELDDKAKTDELLRELVPMFNEFAKKWGLDSLTTFGKFRNTRAQDLNLANIERMHMAEKDTQIFRDNWPAMSKELSALLKKRDAFRRIVDLKAAKKGAHRGINPQDAKKLLDIIRLMTKKSYQRLDARAIPLLQKMTVVPARLPKYAYRGIFYDGAKITKGSDQGWDDNMSARIEAWKKKWAPGSFPKEKPGKATSWSTRMDTAIEFMEAQDNVKDHGNGFHVLIRYDISAEPEVVAADLRAIPENGFWNQQELLLTKEAINYEIVQVFKNGDPKFKTFRDTSKHANWTGGSVGFSYPEVVIADFFTPETHDAGLVEQWRTFKDMTVAQVAEKVGSKEEFKHYPPNLRFPFAALARRCHLSILKDQTTPDEMTASHSIHLSDSILTQVQALAPEIDRWAILFVTAQVSLAKNVFNSFEFDVRITDVRYKNKGEMKSVPQLIPFGKENIQKWLKESVADIRRVRLNFR